MPLCCSPTLYAPGYASKGIHTINLISVNSLDTWIPWHVSKYLSQIVTK